MTSYTFILYHWYAIDKGQVMVNFHFAFKTHRECMFRHYV